jgi:hypothetical protein
MELNAGSDRSSLHDATLISLGPEWRDGRVRSTVRSADGVRTVEFAGVEDLRLSHRLPWGPSEQIDDVSLENLPPGIRVRIQMQSGDTIEIACRSVSLSDAS